MNERVMLRIGAVSLALGLVMAVVFEALHPARENPTGVASTVRVAWEGDQVETSAPRELTVSDPTAPDLAQIQRGSVALTTAVRISTLLPGEREAIFSILRSLNAADELLPRLVGQPGWDAYPARLLVAIVDNYRRELSHLGR